MAFDVENQAHLTALKTEVETDPTGIGYNLADTNDILARLNDPAFNLGGQTGPDKLTPRTFAKALIGVAVSSQDQFTVQLMFEASEGLDEDISDFRLKALTGLGTNVQNAINSITRSLNRAEVLFSDIDSNGVQESVTISRDDWFAARDRG